MQNDSRWYNKKVIETPTTIEVWEYIGNSVRYTLNYGEKAKEEITDKTEKITDSAKRYYDSMKRKEAYYKAMRWEISRLVDCNFDSNTKFMTLTFKDNVQDVKTKNYEFNKFIKRLNFYIYHEKKQKLKYVAVWERQKRGAIHYHVVFFDLPYIKNNELRNIWGNGFVKINKIDVDSIDNRGRYVSKYFTKDIDEKEYKVKSFFKSQNLKIPILKYALEYELSDFSGDNVVFSNEYPCKMPYFTGDDIDFKQGTVKYTRIKKEKMDDGTYKDCR